MFHLRFVFFLRGAGQIHGGEVDYQWVFSMVPQWNSIAMAILSIG